jgi:hypothetical protein
VQRAGKSESEYCPYLLLELLVDCVHGILDRHSLQVASRYLETERKVQVNLLHHWRAKGLLEGFLVINGCRGGVHFPAEHPSATAKGEMPRRNRGKAWGWLLEPHQFSCCVSGAILISTPSFSTRLSAVAQLPLASLWSIRICGRSSPRSAILCTLDAVLLALLCSVFDPFASPVSTAESTLDI